VQVTIENNKACPRYAGITIKGITVKESPEWLKNRLEAIGLRPINNIVDITNYILHETGQPLHAFDLSAVKGNQIIVKNMPEGTSFVTLDGTKRKLSANDLMICNESAPMCIGGVFGGLESGVKDSTTAIFLESAWFNPLDIRKTSLHHGLRTDAATRFEKGVDISNTVNVLKRAALLIKEMAGGEIASDIIDIYPDPKLKTEVALKFHYLKKLSGKNYHPDTIKKILEALGFELIKEGMDEIWLKVPYSKPDISIGADIVEEVLRIDGLDNVEIPGAITNSPSVEDNTKDAWKSKISGYLVGLGFNEILTNSITNSAFYDEKTLTTTVKMMNSLSAELNVLRPSMLETGLQSVAHNINRRSSDLSFFEFGKTYSTSGVGAYSEKEHLCLLVTGNQKEDSWRSKGTKTDIYYIKGIAARILQLAGISAAHFTNTVINDRGNAFEVKDEQGSALISIGTISSSKLEQFGIKQPVLFADINWPAFITAATSKPVKFAELPKQLPVHRDLAFVIPQGLPYDDIKKTVDAIKLDKLKDIQLFDIFESEKLGKGKKSMAVSFTFLDEDKTLTDTEIDGMMSTIMRSFEKELSAEIRK
jgi:phenylalanyl-tRNA synthetase beta chain